MGGCQRVSSSQQKTVNQPSALAESLPAHADATQQRNLPSSLATLGLDQRCSPDVLNGGESEDPCPTQQELGRNQSRADRTAGDGAGDKLSDANTNGCSSPPAELQGETPHMSSQLSLFSGMKLVTNGASPCVREAEGTEDNPTEVTAVNNIQSISGSAINTTVCNPVLSTSSQPGSAFSFVNFWQKLDLISESVMSWQHSAIPDHRPMRTGTGLHTHARCTLLLWCLNSFRTCSWELALKPWISCKLMSASSRIVLLGYFISGVFHQLTETTVKPLQHILKHLSCPMSHLTVQSMQVRSQTHRSTNAIFPAYSLDYEC